MTTFISAGHNPKGIKIDPGAIGNGYHEADLAVEFRNLVVVELLKRKVKVITDNDDERLGDYLKRIQTGSGSVVLEFHFDAAESPTATGATALIGNDADRLDNAFAKELVEITSSVLGIKNRGVLSEKDSHRGSLGLMREQGMVSLLELCFISNPDDLKKYQANKKALAVKIAGIVERYENLM
ncbi:N-acetylmuramoyl-L-alanine amidase [Flavobacterium sp. WC2509]|uniref:N-acetylmuramoyl-L-alanine amidase n=1 Tax=Flavobacterium sp. WC2509 TaxID=3461406 RepID=UPI004044167D